MTYDFTNCKSILKFDGNPWANVTNPPCVYIVNDNVLRIHTSDNSDEKQVSLILSLDLFKKYFENLFTHNILNSNIRVPQDIKQAPFLNNINKLENDFHSITLIGRGGFGKVYSAVNKIDLHIYAIKRVIIDCSKMKQDTLKATLKEFRILAKLNHGNIVRYHTAWFETIGTDSVNGAKDCSNNSRFTALSSSIMSTQHSSSSSSSTDDCTDHSIRLTSSTWAGSVNGSSDSSSDNNLLKSANKSETDSSRSPRCTPFDDNISFTYSSSSGPANMNALISSKCRFETEEDKENRTLEIRRGSTEQFPKTKFALFIQMELCETNLKDWLDLRNTRPGNLEETDHKITRSLACQLLQGIEYLHENNVIHRDIKPANIFLSKYSHDSSNSELQLKIGDFGLAKSFEFDSNDQAVFNQAKMTANVGTAFYSAPEVCNVNHKRIKYNEKCDLYSVGIILLELMTKFRTSSELFRVVTNLSKGLMCNDLMKLWPIEAPHVMNLTSSSPDVRPEANFLLKQTCCFKEIFYKYGIHGKIRELVSENEYLKTQMELLRKENEALRQSSSSL